MFYLKSNDVFNLCFFTAVFYPTLPVVICLKFFTLYLILLQQYKSILILINAFCPTTGVQLMFGKPGFYTHTKFHFFR